MLKPTAQNQRCLMIADQNGRKFFTHVVNTMPLLEFAKTFSMSLSIVDATQPNILKLSDLPGIICDTKAEPDTKVEIVQQIIPPDESKLVHIPFARTRSELLQTYKEVRIQIKKWLINGLVLDLKTIKDSLQSHELSDSSIRNQFNKVKQELIDEGYTISTPQKGFFQIVIPKKPTLNVAETLKMPFMPLTYPPTSASFVTYNDMNAPGNWDMGPFVWQSSSSSSNSLDDN